MKKIMISAALVCLAGFTYAQKPVAGDVTGDVELQFQTGTSAIHILSPNLNARYFLKDDMALRLSLSLNTSSTSQDYTENADGTGGTGTAESSSSGFGIGVGIQKHFAGTERLSPYVGAGISFNSGSSSEDWNNVGMDPFTGQMGYVSGTTVKVDGASTSTFGIGVNAGADYYFVNHIYLGIEVGLGFASTSIGEETTTVTATGVPTTTTVSQGGSSSGINVGANSGLRLGFVF
ncbi:MAG: outer membrane beta-barrel protein [Bacteroidia bacterium]|nr:outer membrane beta-barrel protein [Bacteroidota bacterium]MBK7572443.1 outer membrane beta-barrel protein [Bacteroidota bacterium]MBK8586741.1 outer membrane beta-barrel protein [Bacteroidota bacterium]MBP9791059.1 outer membrane beta-barrel protein [Bacteroidia bacterium]MBP9922530.1 outer membrane beta-barrel protein [Bacteroidia bacterium]